MTYQFRNLVFEGGGVKGIAYVGAMEELERRGILPSVVRVGGASVGAIFAALVGLGYNQREIRDVLWALDFKKLLDGMNIISGLRQLKNDFGWYKGNYLCQWMGKLVAAKAGKAKATFAEVRVRCGGSDAFRELYLMGTNLCTGFTEVYSAGTTPDMPVVDAVRISMSIPLVFAARRNPRGHVCVDGGVMDNYPVKLFDRECYIGNPDAAVRTRYYRAANKALAGREDGQRRRQVYNRETLGFRLDSAEEIARFDERGEMPARPIKGFHDFTLALIGTLLNVQDNAHLHSDDWQRTIYIDTLGVGTMDFALSDERKEALVASGRSGVRKYFQWFDRTGDAVNKMPSPDATARRTSRKGITPGVKHRK